MKKKLLISLALVAGLSATYCETDVVSHVNTNKSVISQNQQANINHKNIILEAKPDSSKIIGQTTINSPIGLWQLQSPSMQGAKITAIPDKTTVNVLAKSNGWYKVEYNGVVGWSYAKYTSGLNNTTSNTTTANTQTKSNSNKKGQVSSPIGLWILGSPSIQGNQIQVMPNGAQFSILGTSGNWTKINYKGTVGYCYTEYITTVSNSSVSNNATSNKVLGTTTITSPVGLWQLAEPSMTGSTIQIIPYQSKVNVIGESNGWYKIEWNGQTGWSYAKYTTGLNGSNKVVSSTNTSYTGNFVPAKSGSCANVNSDIGLWLLSEPSMQGNQIQVMPYGSKLTVLGSVGDWTKVDFNGSTGYCYTKYINKISGAAIGTTMVMPGVGLWLLSEASMSGSPITIIPYHTQLSVYAINNGWYKVSYNGTVGWVDAQYTGSLYKN